MELGYIDFDRGMGALDVRGRRLGGKRLGASGANKKAPLRLIVEADGHKVIVGTKRVIDTDIRRL